MSDWKDTLALILAAFWVIVPVLLTVIAVALAGFAIFLLTFRVLL